MAEFAPPEGWIGNTQGHSEKVNTGSWRAMVSLVWMDRTGGQKGGICEEEEEWRGGWWLVTALQGKLFLTSLWHTHKHKCNGHTWRYADTLLPQRIWKTRFTPSLEKKGRKRRRESGEEEKVKRSEGGQRNKEWKVEMVRGWSRRRYWTSLDEFCRTETHTRKHRCMCVLGLAVSVPGGHLRLRKSDLTAWQRQMVQRVAGMRVFLCFF